jgi:peptidoglycan LD-endopeptidase LytH
MLEIFNRRHRRNSVVLGGVVLLITIAIVGVCYVVWHYRDDGGRTDMLLQYLKDPAGHADWSMHAGHICADAPFAFPTDGYIGYLWGDMFQAFHRHQGIDIFGGSEPGQTAVYAAYDGLLTRLPDWKSAVIIRVPSDPLHPGAEIWLYYAHMATPEGISLIEESFSAGTFDRPVHRGDRLGFQGNYTGDPNNPAGVHLHFSIVKGNGKGGWWNELEIANTLDPSPYFGMLLHSGMPGKGPVVCDK